MARPIARQNRYWHLRILQLRRVVVPCRALNAAATTSCTVQASQKTQALHRSNGARGSGSAIQFPWQSQLALIRPAHRPAARLDVGIRTVVAIA